jgi:two-component system, chemotaxis family, protein-glutamate methylesterase/glutaminase
MIVIGASLGGMLAVQAVLGSLPTHFPLPVVIALHRPPDNGDLLTPILQRTCVLRVSEVIDKEPIENGRVYVAPPDYHVLTERDHLSLSVDERVNHARPSIDVLFESAAFAHGPRAIAVVLTGAGADGARGAAAIERAGGTVVIEDPETAFRADMPAAARAATAAARVLMLEHVAAALCDLARTMANGVPDATRFQSQHSAGR